MLLNIMLLADHGKKKNCREWDKKNFGQDISMISCFCCFVFLEANNDIASRDALQP